MNIRKNDVSFVIQGDSDGQVISSNASQFEILTKKIPSNWIISTGIFEFLVIEPKNWHAPGFWDRYYEHDPEIIKIFKQEAKIIYDEENL